MAARSGRGEGSCATRDRQADAELKDAAQAPGTRSPTAEKVRGRDHQDATPCWKAAAGLQLRSSFGIARTLRPRRRGAAEAERRAPARVRATPACESLKLQLFSDEPIYDDFEIAQAGRRADLPGEHARRRQRARARRCWPASRRASGAVRADQRHRSSRDVDGPQEAVRGRQGGGRRAPRTR